eukprot:g4465.t1
MLTRFSRSFDRKRDGKIGMKLRFDVRVTKAVGTFDSTTGSLRVLWNRGGKVQVTPPCAITSGSVHFDVLLSQVATLYKDSKNTFEEKHYSFKLQTVTPEKGGKTRTIGKAQLELSQYASTDSTRRTVVLPLTTTNPKLAKGMELHFEISSSVLKGGIPEDDSMSGVSGMSIISSGSPIGNSPDQDLTGFESLDSQSNSEKIGILTAANSSELTQSLSLSQESEKSCVLSITSGVLEGVSMMQTRVKDLEQELDKERKEKLELQKEIENLKEQSKNEVSFLRRIMASEQAEKMKLENQLVREVSEFEVENSSAEDSETPYKVKYNTLVEVYNQVVTQCENDVVLLQDEVLDLRDHVAKLENLLEVNERTRATLVSEKLALERSLIGYSGDHLDMDNERRELQQELTQVESLMHDLIETKMKYAELSEKHTISRQEIYSLKEKNLKLATKLTKIEISLYHKTKTSKSFSLH